MTPRASSTGKTRAASTKSQRQRSWVRVQGGPTIAVIDMGTNSFHMIVCKASEDRDHFEIITRVKEAVPFFRRALSNHFIDDEALRAASRILKDMIKKAFAAGATTILAVATSAVRESKNGEDALEKLRKELSLDARMISGKEEARLIYLGVLWAMPELKEVFCIVDIGGGSTEIIVSDRQHTFFAESYKLGAARLTQRFFKNRSPDPESIAELHDEVKGVLRPCAARIESSGGFRTLIGTSGTVQTLAKLDQERLGEESDLAGWKITRERLEHLVLYLEEAALKGERVKGISQDRNQTILAGAVVLLETMRSFNAAETVLCTAALREGVIVDRFLQTGWLKAGLEQHRDPRSGSVHTLLEKYHGAFEHAEQVARISRDIFVQTRGILHNHPEEVGHLLWSSAMLHDVGMFIGRNGHHKHSYYLIKNAGLLGHSEEEVAIIANIARYHRGSEPKESHESYMALPPEARKLVCDLSAILRVAEALDRSHRQVVRALRVVMEPFQKGGYERRLISLALTLKPGENCYSEVWALHEKKHIFEEHFQVRLDVLVDAEVAVNFM